MSVSTAKTEYCVGIRFSAPDTPYAAPLSKPPLQAFVAHATLRCTKYKVIDDLVFETRLFPDCPHGVDQSLCDARELNEGSDPFVWKSSTAMDGNFKLSALQASLFITEHAKKKNAADQLGVLLDSLSLYVEDAPGVGRSSTFRDALSSWWSTEEDKNALKLARRFRTAVGERSFVMMNGFLLDIEGMRQGVDPLLSCLSVTSTVAHHLSPINLNKGTQKILPPRAIAGATENSARVRVLLSVDQQSTENSEQKGDVEPSQPFG